jgi:uncharacterized SAM-binding protein YcdF (DUF218 family)
LRKRRNKIKAAFAVAIICLFSFFVIAGSTFFHIYSSAKKTIWPDTQPAINGPTVVIVLGMGPTPTNAILDRSELAAELWRAGFVSEFIASGGQGSDEVESEAQTIAKDLVSRGIPGSIIIQESESTSTYENLTLSQKILARHDRLDVPIVIITHDFHAARVGSMADSLGMDAVVISSSGARLNNRFRRSVREVLAFLKWKIVGR